MDTRVTNLEVHTSNPKSDFPWDAMQGNWVWRWEWDRGALYAFCYLKQVNLLPI